MQKEINFYQEMASEHRLQEYSKGPVPLYIKFQRLHKKVILFSLRKKEYNNVIFHTCHNQMLVLN